jgi:RNA polymerase sigma-70 factor (ECF subfamily)
MHPIRCRRLHVAGDLTDLNTARTTDRQLVERINAGEVEAFETLYRRHRAWAISVGRRFAPDAATAEDAVQEAFIYLLGKFPGFTLRARLTTVLYPAIKHAALRASKRRDPAPLPAGLEITGANTSPDSDVRRALGALPEAMREVILMRVVDEMRVREIALALEIPEGTVKSRIHQALERLKADPSIRRYFD